MLSTASFPRLLLAAAVTTALTGCVTMDEYGNPQPMSQTAQGAGLGALAGAATGAALGSLSANAGRGALIGAIGGALVGAAVGNYMEQQRLDFERALANEIQRGDIRIEKLPNDQLLVSMTSNTAFDFDSTRIKPGFYSTMDKIANIVNQYGKTQLTIGGHTDSVGSDQYNLDLSRRRAAAVQSYLLGDQVLPARLSAYGYGETQPIASNNNEDGRQLNRRVDITIVPIVEG
ncbi:OmpA family protein [Rhodoferax sp. 4810]|uniref:OmpA family protein n=2 Tax=Thiospirillum jenense TaxID=1653858 RepID=A0A839HFT7_9GAMM|nr:OmpA family protein [Rhodoferax jenense]MBB1126920.1 OmpA family protein [Thiospirillum jenense]